MPKRTVLPEEHATTQPSSQTASQQRNADSDPTTADDHAGGRGFMHAPVAYYSKHSASSTIRSLGAQNRRTLPRNESTSSLVRGTQLPASRDHEHQAPPASHASTRGVPTHPAPVSGW